MQSCGSFKEQSPINLCHSSAVEKELGLLEFRNYDIEYPVTVTNDGHTIKLNYESCGSFATISRGDFPGEYILDHIHFHWPSEHTVNDKQYALEAHLVHYCTDYESLTEAISKELGVIVIATLYEASDKGDNGINDIICSVSQVQSEIHNPKPLENIKLNEFLPEDTENYFTYKGSLTTPDFNEGVTWIVFATILPITCFQVSVFNNIKDHSGEQIEHNNRELQDIKDRIIYVTKKI